MHYYKRNLGDYAKKAGRLSMLQHGAYTLLTDACYDRERFPTRDEAVDWTWASSKEEVEAVDFVLRRFFVEQSDGTFVQKRIFEEVSAFQEKKINNKRIADEREAKRREEKQERKRDVHETCTNGEHVVDEAPPNQEPRTINQEPLTNIEEVLTSPSAKADPIPYSKIVDAYHDYCPDLPRVQEMTDKRRKAIRQRHITIMEKDLGNWAGYFRAASQSNFLMGKVKDWRASFDFLITEKAAVGVLEGKYR